MYTLKTIARRGTALGMAASLIVAAVIPGAAAFADALNPLTERSLLLSSSSPGYAFSDGSGNHEDLLNAEGEFYSPPGSGPNGQKTGETFTFTMSSTVAAGGLKGMSFQYCTTAAGNCQAPGDNAGDADINDDGIVEAQGDPDNTRLLNEDSAPGANDGGWYAKTSDLNVVGTFVEDKTDAVPLYDAVNDTGGGDFTVYKDTAGDGVFTPLTSTSGWTMSAVNAEDPEFVGPNGTPSDGDDPLTGKINYMILTNADGVAVNGGDQVKVVFNPTDDIFITNPGSGSFFVKINTYDTDNTALFTNTVKLADNTNVIDGGVTVANVMTESIHITTKVLETMSFSVGLENRDTENVDSPDSHGTCDAIQVVNNNRLNLGNPDAEYSLETKKAWDVYSYWRLSSNSSGGATVYYSGDTLRNTVGDHIEESGASATTSLPGTEQFGLAFVDATADDLEYWQPTLGGTSYVGDGDEDFWVDTNENGILDAVTGSEDTGDVTSGVTFDTVAPFLPTSTDHDFRLPSLYTLTEETPYASGTGTIDNGNGGPGTAAFAFLSSSLTVPELIAQNNTDVIRCDTAKMRYVGNIAADTPAGVYTTKINYLAAPQY